jgi:hypothetical protein
MWRTFCTFFILATLLLPSCPVAGACEAKHGVSTLEQIANTYQIRFITTPSFPASGGKIVGKCADADALASYIALFASEFSLYPPEPVKRSRLKTVVFCQGIFKKRSGVFFFFLPVPIHPGNAGSPGRRGSVLRGQRQCSKQRSLSSSLP